jgi:glycosyltransferase involved in cell wall biosynthesis
MTKIHSSQLLLSVIVPTRNSASTLEACLKSILNQTYPNIELIVVDRDSTDATKRIAQKFTDHIYNYGPERSAQRNFGAKQANGKYLLMIDSDMELAKHVVEECVHEFIQEPRLLSLVVPEESFGQGFWAQCKRLERSFYVGAVWIEASRAFRAEIFENLNGYDESLISGEDWDLSRRVDICGPAGRIKSYIRHNEGRIKLYRLLKKKYYYAQQARAYLMKNPVPSKLAAPVGPVARYKLFFAHPRQLLSRPFIGAGMLFMKTCEFAFGAAGYLFGSHDDVEAIHE